MPTSPSPNQPLPSARAAAVVQLNRIEQDGAYVGLADAGSVAAADPRTERQTTEYVAGVTRWRRWLDFLLTHYYRGRFEGLEPTLLQILRIGTYDLALLETPPHAAVHEAVALAKSMVRPQAGALVNGVLRALLRGKDAWPAPNTGKLFRNLAIEYSHPNWLVRRWLARWGEADTRTLLAWNNARPSYGVRINTGRLPYEAFLQQAAEADLDVTPSPYLDDFVRMRRLQPLLQTNWLEMGLCSVQDEAAGLVVRLLDPQPGEVVYDLCAAPGGKALYAATRMGNHGQVLALDLHAARLGLLEKTAPQHHLSIITTEATDVRLFAARTDAPLADRVLVDAPCSGLGVLAKRADLRWQRTAEDLAGLVALQDELLDAAVRLVKPGGLLVYSTCTIAPEENAERVAALLARHPEFSFEPAHGLVPASTVTAEGFYATLPHVHGIDGAFGARLRRNA